MARILFDANTGLLELLGLTELITGVAVDSATVTGDVQNQAGTSVFGPTAMPSVGASVTRTIDGVSQTFAAGNYRVIVPETTTYTLKTNGKFERHNVIVIADDGVNRDGRWEQEVPVSKRDFSE